MTSAVRDWTLAVALWLGLAVSAGWYYTVTYYGRTGLPVPTPEVMASFILYYFSVLNVETELQAVHWMAVFPLAGILWTLCLWVLAPRFNFARPPAGRLALWLALCSIPLVAPAPGMTLVAARTEDGFDAARMLAVALRRGGVAPWPGLNALYLGLGAASLVLEGAVLRRLFSWRGRRGALHGLTAAIALVVAAATAGALAAMPLRAWLE
jgi:hypothetical protein